MSDVKLTVKERADFAAPQVLSALKWIAGSGTATYMLTEILKGIDQIELPVWAVIGSYVVINTLLFAVGKYVEGETKEK